MQARALFPGTFDPITYGHLDLIERASKLFSEVLVAVAADTYGKTATLSLVVRESLVKEAVKKYSNVSVINYEGLTANCVLKNNAHIIVRGLRNSSDFEYEQRVATVNKQLAPNVETVFLATSPQHAHISATLVRQIAQLHGDINSLVPEHVKLTLEQYYAE